ncbi:MAG TPA: rod shape-determining protein MreC [Blastocatellia bacterium]|nr:rod shape-determining protein MreC [Blastocatellia bacterium]
MSANPAQSKSSWLLAVLLLSQVIMMSYFAKKPDGDSQLGNYTMSVLAFVARGADWVLSGVTGTVGSYVDLRGARQENIELKERIEQLTAERNEALERAAELDLLRSQLALPERPKYRQVAANVISRDPSLWFRRLVIDRGSLDGVKKNMPVVTGLGIVGRVIAVGPNHSVVQAITDKHAGVGGMLQRSRAMGEVRGMDNALCELQSIRTTEKVEVGDVVVTTGLDRIYPKGLVIGAVERIENDPNAPWHKIIVNPAARIDRVEQVLVLLVEQKDLEVVEAGK